MPRAERPLDDDQTELGRFAADLRRLREKDGKPSYRELASRAHYSAAALSDAAGGRKLPSLAVTLAYVKACGGDEQEWEERWRSIAAPPAPTSEAPYVGLKAFHKEDTDRFFGRETLTAKLVDLVAERPFVGVFGASGSGKSSLLRAGLLPRLEHALIFTPGVHPIDECAVRLAQLTGESAVVLHSELADPAALGLRIKQHHEDLVLVVDQFEEVFTLCGPEQRDWFVQALTRAPHVVIGVRADFYRHVGRHPELVEALDRAQVLVGPMTTDELRRAITEPARLVGATVETALVTRLVADVAGQVAVLPLVQHALAETWHRRRGMTLSLAGYEEAGGVEHAIARTAESVYQQLTEDQQQIVRRTFLRLIALGEGTEDTKRRAAREDLDAEVLEHLAAARLVTLSEQHAELTHEALIRSWPRLRDWIEEDRDALRVHHQLTEAAAAWDGHDRDFLYKGVRLAQAGELSPDSLTESEHAFLEASQIDDRRRARRSRAVVSTLVVLVVLLAGSVVIAVRAAREVGERLDEAVAIAAAEKAKTLVATNPELALKVALAAWHVSADPRVREAAQTVYTTTSGLTSTVVDVPATNFVAVSGDGALAISATDGERRVWSLARETATPRGRLSKGEPGAAMSGDGKTVILVVKSSTEIWDISDPDAPKLRLTLPVPVIAGSVAHDGTSFLGVKVRFDGDALTQAPDPKDRESLLWDISDATQPVARPMPCQGVASPSLRPDGKRIAIVCGGAAEAKFIRVWKIEGGQFHVVLDHLYDEEVGARPGYSPTGRFLSMQRQDGQRFQLWDMTMEDSPQIALNLAGESPVDIAFGRDDHLVALSNKDKMTLWGVDAEDGPTHLNSLSGPAMGAVSLAYRRDEDEFIGSAVGQNSRLWRLPVDISWAERMMCADGRNLELPDEDWVRYFPDVERVPVC